MTRNIRLNSTRSAAVDQDYFWNEDFTHCPIGAKVQLLNPGGVATYGTWNGKDRQWLGWAPLPKRRNKQQEESSDD